MSKNTSCGVQLRIRGKVQGVGFRPFVWQLAQQLNLHGDVCNDGDGVEVRLLEDPETFLVQLHQTARRWRVLIASSVSRLSGHNCPLSSLSARAQAAP